MIVSSQITDALYFLPATVMYCLAATATGEGEPRELCPLNPRGPFFFSLPLSPVGVTVLARSVPLALVYEYRFGLRVFCVH